MFAFIKVSVESSLLTSKDVQKNRDTNVKTKVQITKADRSRVEELTPAVMNGKIAKIFQQDGNLTINKRTSNREPNSNKSKRMQDYSFSKVRRCEEHRNGYRKSKKQCRRNFQRTGRI